MSDSKLGKLGRSDESNVLDNLNNVLSSEMGETDSQTSTETESAVTAALAPVVARMHTGHTRQFSAVYSDDTEFYIDSSVPQSAEPDKPGASDTASAASISMKDVLPRIKSVKLIEQIERDSSNDLIEVSVTDPKKATDAGGSYINYKINTKTNMKCFKEEEFSVTRRFSDFLALHDKLVQKYLHSGYIIPPTPDKNLFETARLKIKKPGEKGRGVDFIERRRAALERYLNRTLQHPSFRQDPEVQQFLELEDLPKPKNVKILSGAGVRRLFKRVGDKAQQLGFNMEENDKWFYDKARQIETLEVQLKKLFIAVDALVHYRHDLSISSRNLSKACSLLSKAEDHPTIAALLKKLSEHEDKIQAIYVKQENADFYIFSELLNDYLALIGGLRDAFHERAKIFHLHQHCDQMLSKKRKIKARLEHQRKKDLLLLARTEVAEWESKLEISLEEFEDISRNIKKEVERFDEMRVHDFCTSLTKYLETLLIHQQQLTKCWEKFLPEMKAIGIADNASKSK